MENEFGRLLREARERRGLSQAELGRLINADHAYISRIEAGKLNPMRERTEELLGALGINTPQEQMKFLLAAGQLNRADVAKAAAEIRLEDQPEAAPIKEIVRTIMESETTLGAPNAQALVAVDEAVGEVLAEQVPHLRELFAHSALSKDTAKEVLQKALEQAIVLLDLVAQSNKETDH